MGLEKRKPRKFLSIYKGKIRHKQGDSEEFYDSLTGTLQKIELKTEEYQGQKSRRWYFHFTEGGTLFLLKSSEDTVFANSLLNCLGSADLSAPITVSPYITGEKEIAVPYVEQSGEQVPWAIEELPDDETARRKFMRKVASRLNEIAASHAAPEPGDEDAKNVVPASEPSEPEPQVTNEALGPELYGAGDQPC
jgi:hypothetical protein